MISFAMRLLFGSKKAIYSMSKKLKFLAVGSVVWLLWLFADVIHDEYEFPARFFRAFFDVGIIPVVIVWGLVWIFRKPPK